MKDKALKIINYFGIKHQLKKLSEETYEFQEAVLECNNKEHILEEMADIQVLLLQFKELLDIDDNELIEEMKFKLNRTEERYLKEVKDIQNYEPLIRSEKLEKLAKKYQQDYDKLVGMTD